MTCADDDLYQRAHDVELAFERCEPWCRLTDRHRSESFREDQYCLSVERRVQFSLEDCAPGWAMPVDDVAPHIGVYARRDYYRMPYIMINLFRENRNEFRCIDTDFKVTPLEALELAEHLMAVVAQVVGGGA